MKSEFFLNRTSRFLRNQSATFYVLMMFLLCFSVGRSQNVEIQGQLKVTELNQNDTAEYVLIQNQDTTIGKRAVSSLLEVQGTAPGQIKYWNGSEWVLLPIGETGQVLTVSDSLIPQWKTPQKTGKPYIIIQGDISNEDAAQRIQEDFGSSTQFLWIKNTKSLTSLDLSMFTSLIELRIVNNMHLENVILNSLVDVVDVIEVNQNSVLLSFALNNLQTFSGSKFELSNNSNLTEISMNNFYSLNSNLSIGGNTSLIALHLPVLTSNHGDFYIGGNRDLTIINFQNFALNYKVLQINSNKKLHTIEMPQLQFNYYLEILGCDSLISLYFPLLSEVSAGILIENNDNLSLINLPELTDINGQLEIRYNSNLSSLLVPNIIVVNGGILVEGNPNLGNVIFPNLLNYTGGIVIKGNQNLSSIEFPALHRAANIILEDNESLSIIDIPLLDTCYNLSINNLSSLATISFANLKRLNGLWVVNNTGLNSVFFPDLDSVDYAINVSSNSLLSQINFSNLTWVNNNIYLNENVSIINVDFPALQSIGGSFTCNYNTELSSLIMPNLNQFLSVTFNAQNNKFSSNIVNALLARFVALGNTPLQNIYLNSQNPPAPPTGQGIIDKNTLIAAGKTVNTD